MEIRVHEKFLNVVWSMIALGVAYATFLEIQSSEDLELLIWLLIHCSVALLFLIRKPPVQFASSISSLIIPLISVNFYLLYDLSATTQEPLIFFVGRGISLIGLILCLISTLALGRCFAILPACRGVKTHLTYQWVRHPIYASYLILDGGILISHATLDNLLVFISSALLFVLRIRYEEDLLEKNENYRDYQKKVSFRLIRGVY